MRCWLHALARGDTAQIGRTSRAFQRAGCAVTIVDSRDDLVARLYAADGPVLLAAAGSWLVHSEPLPEIPRSATGRPLIALGAVRNSPGADQWRAVLEKYGGDFDRWRFLPPRLPPPDCAWLEAEPARQLGQLLAAGDDWSAAWRRLLALRAFRKVHFSPLDVQSSSRLRVLQVVTSIQVGGAERVTLDLASELATQRVDVAVVALGQPTRAAFPEPQNFFDLSRVSYDTAACAEAVARVATDFGADLVHAHLLSADEMRAIRGHGFPLVVTLHNMPEAWPAGLRDGGLPVADLILACSRAVAEQAETGRLGAPVRTVWNGIDSSSVVTSESREKVRCDWRKRLGWTADDFVIVVLANPRRQKRLERLPPILVALQERLGSRRARILLAGEPARGSGDAEDAQAMLAAAIEQCPLRASIYTAGALHAIGDALATGDVLLAVSAFEGLSLAQLEALAAGLPVVATDVGGTREIAAHTTALKLVPRAAEDGDVVAALAEIASLPSGSTITLPRSFTRREMASRTRWFYPQFLRPRRLPGEGLWLITNNFSTGGAQSSARRLLVGLAARGIKVRAALVEEHPSQPTPGRAALVAAGVPVLAVPPPDAIDAPEAVAQALAAIDADRPRAILFWNLMPVFKILFADALLDVPIFDVSPGEMYFASLARYFANPRPALPYLDAREYGARLAGVVVKYAAEAEIANRTLGAPVHVIRNGVLLSDTPRPQRNGCRFVIGTAVRLSPDKRLGDLIEAVRLAAPRLPRFVLRIAGGPERGSEEHTRDLRRQARGLPVKWCGELADTRDFLADLDLFVMISEPSGCPNASLEALAAGVPIIATDVGGACEQVIDGTTGRLVPRRDARALADAIVELAHDPARRVAFAEAGRAHVRAEFSLERMLDGYARLCDL